MGRRAPSDDTKRFALAAAAACATAAAVLSALLVAMVSAAPALADGDGEKVETPVLSKQVLEDGAWSDAADAAAGEDVSYRLVGTLPSNWDEFSFYYYSFVDEPDEAIVVDLDSVRVVLVDAETGEETDVTDAFEVRALDDGSFSVTCEDLKSIEAFAAAEHGDEVVLRYEARMDADSIATGTSGAMVNTAYIVYTSRTYTTALGKSVEDSATLYTWELALLKVSATDGAALAGAGFTVLDVDSGLYLDADGGLHQDAVVVRTDEDGSLSMVGIGSGTYLVSEVEAPEGYLAADDLVLAVSFDAQAAALSAEVAGEDASLIGLDSSGGVVYLLVYDEEEPAFPLARIFAKTGDALTDVLPVLVPIALLALVVALAAARRAARRPPADPRDKARPGRDADRGR